MAIIDTSGLEPFADLLKEIYGDVAKPGVVQVGIALATVIGLLNTCLSPIKFLNEKTELNRQNNLKLLAKRFSEIPPENIIEAPPEIAVPIAEKLGYVSNEELRNLYIELLAKASTKDLNSKAHPSFVNIINNLSPDEAKLIEYLNKNQRLPIVDITVSDSQYMKYYIEQLVCLTPELTLDFPQNLKAYFSNLEASGLIQIEKGKWVYEDKEYDVYLDYLKSNIPRYDSEYSYIKKELDPDNAYSLEKGSISVTDLGIMFFSAVL